jgi:hypothetical protein
MGNCCTSRRKGGSVADSPDFEAELKVAIAPYRELLIELVDDDITPEEFEEKYFRAYADDPAIHSDAVFDVVDGFFAEVDAYVSNPAIRDLSSGDLGPDELRAKAQALLRRAGG